MPRSARIKNSNFIYHIICNSITELQLFKEDSDKEYYYSILSRYKSLLGFKIYSIALMDTHLHMILDPLGADISSIMKSINISYVQYYNKKYSRKGSLFINRFKSIPIVTQDHLYKASLYIHKNPLDIPKWKDKLEKYPYSSLGYFLGVQKNRCDLIDPDIIMRLFGGNINKARKVYSKKISCDNRVTKDVEYKLISNNKSEYRSERIINKHCLSPQNVLTIISKHTKLSSKLVFIKHHKSGVKLRCLLSFILRKYCGFSIKSICDYLGNFTEPTISVACNDGLNLISDKNFISIINEIKSHCKAISSI